MVTLNTNVQSLNAQRLVNINSANLARTTQRLSSGLRVNSASDDPSGLAIAESLTSQLRGDKMASDQNIQQGQSMIQVADSGPSQIGDILQRMRELSVQANNTGLTTNEMRAQEIVLELLHGLKPNGDPAVDNLCGLHTYIYRILYEANVRKRGELIDQAVGQLRDLLETWERIVMPGRHPEAGRIVSIDRHC